MSDGSMDGWQEAKASVLLSCYAMLYCAMLSMFSRDTIGKGRAKSV